MLWNGQNKAKNYKLLVFHSHVLRMVFGDRVLLLLLLLVVWFTAAGPGPLHKTGFRLCLRTGGRKQTKEKKSTILIRITINADNSWPKTKDNDKPVFEDSPSLITRV